MNAEHTTEKEHNRKTDEEEIEKIKEDLELATEKVVYFEDIIRAADSLRKMRLFIIFWSSYFLLSPCKTIKF